MGRTEPGSLRVAVASASACQSRPRARAGLGYSRDCSRGCRRDFSRFCLGAQRPSAIGNQVARFRTDGGVA
jgi:hypothetical protein